MKKTDEITLFIILFNAFNNIGMCC